MQLLGFSMGIKKKTRTKSQQAFVCFICIRKEFLLIEKESPGDGQILKVKVGKTNPNWCFVFT